eukprot:CAMPEP_0172485794 /NCGR_PEP_ID=MMETSP1066-20121228/13985_1 /TAXON_ID=671091 /ORGANISM="Coscinodiscus wailesii, Strain CCMP2513" /LENGTH=341 /DNA_ID=CAMNT_0013251265 /DNA_START=115 /DNA_END=1140 /DNA_ORIENTATION=-
MMRITTAPRKTSKRALPIYLLLNFLPHRTSSLSLFMSSSSSISHRLTIDSHLHVWADEKESSSYPYAEGQVPPPALQNRGSTASLLEEMKSAKVDGALIVQPINHKFDHGYVEDAVAAHPTLFKGMMLHDPSLGAEIAVSRLEDLVLKGFVGVRFNPYLWEEGETMSKEGGAGMAVYRRCGELSVPVGVMCFKGLEGHYEDIVRLVTSCPSTSLILDHFGFTRMNDEGDKAFEQLLSLSQYPSVHVKISAVFRIADGKASFEEVRVKRFLPLLKAFGAERLMFGTDFPFVLEQEGGYKGAVDVVTSWLENDDDKRAIMGGTAQRLFGSWGHDIGGKSAADS